MAHSYISKKHLKFIVFDGWSTEQIESGKQSCQKAPPGNCIYLHLEATYPDLP